MFLNPAAQLTNRHCRTQAAYHPCCRLASLVNASKPISPDIENRNWLASDFSPDKNIPPSELLSFRLFLPFAFLLTHHRLRFSVCKMCLGGSGDEAECDDKGLARRSTFWRLGRVEDSVYIRGRRRDSGWREARLSADDSGNDRLGLTELPGKLLVLYRCWAGRLSA